MATRNIVEIGNQTLRKKSKPVVDFDEDLGKLFDDMRQTMVEKNGMGIAAVQVGVLRRALIVEIEPKKYLEICNPTIIEAKGKCKNQEGCLSVPGFYTDVERPWYVKIEAFDRHGKRFEFEGEDYVARCICHEMDHLDGILFVDYTKAGKDYKKKKGVE